MFDSTRIKALTFDVFGTVVDWRESIIREGKALARAKGLDVDWAKFADAWRGLYQPAMNRVRRGEVEWTKLDDLHRMSLVQLLGDFRITGLTEAEVDDFNRAWHRLDPWPDAVPGLSRLKRRFILATLSNGNVALMVNMAKRAGLPWDAILGAEVARAYKPQPAAYLRSVEALGLRPEDVAMVAAHNADLAAAAACGLKTAFVLRPTEDTEPTADWDIVAPDFLELASQCGA
jgi:2-haloacid dehalogenase